VLRRIKIEIPGTSFLILCFNKKVPKSSVLTRVMDLAFGRQ